MAISSVSTSAAALLSNKSGTPPLTPLTFDSLGAMETHLFGVEKKAVAKYRSEFEKEDNKAISVDEMKEMLKKRFPGYTLTDTEPTDPVKGKHLLYIDDTNMNKLANDADYRAKVMGLMEREYAGNAPMTFNLGNTKFHSNTTGSVFSLSEKNPSVDGIPYLGMAMGEGGSETTGPSDGPLPPDFLSKTKADKAKGKYAAMLTPEQRYAAYNAGLEDARVQLARENAEVASVTTTAGAGLADNEYSRGLIAAKKDTAATLNAWGKKLGVRIEIVDQVLGGRANGQYLKEQNLIQIAADSDKRRYMAQEKKRKS